MSSDSHQKLANQIVDLIKNGDSRPGSPDLEETLKKIQLRLDSIETKLNTPNPQSALLDLQPEHPSQQKFDVIEAIADQIIENQLNEKTCTFEPNGKPCDHCSMCSSRGF